MLPIHVGGDRLKPLLIGSITTAHIHAANRNAITMLEIRFFSTSCKMDGRALAAEREARLRARGIDPTAPGESKVAANPWQSQCARPQQPARTSSLYDAHRSIRMAHSAGFAVCLLSAVLLLFPWVTHTKILVLCFMVGAVWLARSGGTWLHNSLLPPTLQEGPAPTAQQVEAHDKSLFTPRLTAQALNEEWHTALDSLAWCCTYGKKNCITTAIYSQDEPLTLSKIARITWAKVSEGTFRCN